MKRSSNASLKKYNSFAVEARAAELVEIESETDLETIAAERRFDAGRDLLLGGGSNVLFAGDIEGRVLVNRLPGKRIVDDADGGVLVEAGGGENWHRLVMWSLDQGLCGLENLSLIPGLAGAAPIQNIGAYGVELSDVLESVQALDLKAGQYRVFSNADCRFGYRDSVFKTDEAACLMIVGIRLRLRRRHLPRLEFNGLAEELFSAGQSHPTARQVSEAVIRLRLRKLPDPGVKPNAGSFFKNPVVSQSRAQTLKQTYADLPVFPLDDGMCKLSAAWMIEHCGFKGRREGDAGVSERHALVLVNHGNASGRDILALADNITESVWQRFEIRLQTEPRIIGTARP